MIQRGDFLLIRHKTGFAYKLISLALVVVVLALAAQACGGKEKEVSITPSSTLVETPVPTIINTQTPVTTLEPTSIPTPELTSTPTISPATIPTPVTALTISVEDVKLKLDSGQNFILVDVREQSDFDTSHINTAISIPVDELPDRYEEIPQGLEIIIYAECA